MTKLFLWAAFVILALPAFALAWFVAHLPEPRRGAHDTDGESEAHLNYEPTILPVAVGGYYWVVFTSLREYGNTITDPIAMTAAGASLTMQAGRSALINNNVSTNNGAISVTANDPGAIAANRSAVAGSITMAAGTTLNAGNQNITLTTGNLVGGTPGDNEKDGGESGIRTHEAVLAPTRFPIVLLQPLGHLSAPGGHCSGARHGAASTTAP